MNDKLEYQKRDFRIFVKKRVFANELFKCGCVHRIEINITNMNYILYILKHKLHHSKQAFG